MTTLKNIHVETRFDAAGNLTGATVTRYRDVDGYRQTVEAQLAALPSIVQAAFAAVVSALTPLRAADERIVDVFGELLPAVPDQSHDEPFTVTDPETGGAISSTRTVVDSWRDVVGLAVTLQKLTGGQRTIPVTTEQLTPDARAAVLALWAAMEAE